MRLRPWIANNYLNWKQVIDHVAGVVLVMLARLNVAIGIFGTGQQCGLTPLIRRNPIEFPTSPRLLLNRIYEFCLGPGLAAASAYRYLRRFGLPRPGSAKHCVRLVRFAAGKRRALASVPGSDCGRRTALSESEMSQPDRRGSPKPSAPSVG